MEIVTNKYKIDLLESAFGEGMLANSGQNITVKCPNCKKVSKTVPKKRKLSICLSTGIYHCWVCESKGKNIASFAYRNDVKKSLIADIKEAFGIIQDQKADNKEVLRLPDDFKLIALDMTSRSRVAKDYLQGRGLTSDDFLSFKIGISSEYEFVNRVIFPSFSNTMELNFYVSRTYDKNERRKYKNCIAKKKEIIFDDYKINWNDRIVLVEGVFDAIKAGYNAIPVLGSWIDESYAVFQKIVKNRSDVILAFDSDAKLKTLKIAQNLNSYDINVKLIQNNNNDLGSMSKEEAQYHLVNAKQYETTDRMRYLIGDIRSGSLF
jgi:DNA primase